MRWYISEWGSKSLVRYKQFDIELPDKAVGFVRALLLFPLLMKVFMLSIGMSGYLTLLAVVLYECWESVSYDLTNVTPLLRNTNGGSAKDILAGCLGVLVANLLTIVF